MRMRKKHLSTTTTTKSLQQQVYFMLTLTYKACAGN